jgi:uncharacterized protein YbaR (Trm112 family)
LSSPCSSVGEKTSFVQKSCWGGRKSLSCSCLSHFNFVLHPSSPLFVSLNQTGDFKDHENLEETKQNPIWDDLNDCWPNDEEHTSNVCPEVEPKEVASVSDASEYNVDNQPDKEEEGYDVDRDVHEVRKEVEFDRVIEEQVKVHYPKRNDVPIMMNDYTRDLNASLLTLCKFASSATHLIFWAIDCHGLVTRVGRQRLWGFLFLLGFHCFSRRGRVAELLLRLLFRILLLDVAHIIRF